MRCRTASAPPGPCWNPPRSSRFSRYTYPCLPAATPRCGMRRRAERVRAAPPARRSRSPRPRRSARRRRREQRSRWPAASRRARTLQPHPRLGEHVGRRLAAASARRSPRPVAGGDDEGVRAVGHRRAAALPDAAASGSWSAADQHRADGAGGGDADDPALVGRRCRSGRRTWRTPCRRASGARGAGARSVALKATLGWLSAVPWICTGKPVRSASVGMSTACI